MSHKLEVNEAISKLFDVIEKGAEEASTQDVIEATLHRYRWFTEASKKFDALASNAKEIILDAFSNSLDTLAKDTEKHDSAQTEVLPFAGYALTLSTKRASSRLDQKALRTELIRAGVKAEVVDTAMLKATKATKVPVSIQVTEIG